MERSRWRAPRERGDSERGRRGGRGRARRVRDPAVEKDLQGPREVPVHDRDEGTEKGGMTAATTPAFCASHAFSLSTGYPYPLGIIHVIWDG